MQLPHNWSLSREREAEAARRERKVQKKNLGLLSFGEEAGEEDEEDAPANLRLQSAFDAVDTDDPRSYPESSRMLGCGNSSPTSVAIERTPPSSFRIMFCGAGW